MKNANTYPQLVLRLALGLGFILPVLDRFGVMGTPGTKGVSWAAGLNLLITRIHLLLF